MKMNCMWKYFVLVHFLLGCYCCTANGFVCTVQNGMFSNPDNQHTFYTCANGIPYLQQCPSSLVWSDTDKRCDYESSKTCLRASFSL